VWSGAFGPRALVVTGRSADGWTPSLGYMPAEQIPAMRRRIDNAAEAAGRRPEDIRSILNVSIRIDPGAQPQPDAVTGPAKQVASQLQDLLGLGFTGFNFILSSPDQIATMRQIAENGLPILRSAGSAGHSRECQFGVQFRQPRRQSLAVRRIWRVCGRAGRSPLPVIGVQRAGAGSSHQREPSAIRAWRFHPEKMPVRLPVSKYSS